MECIKNKIIFAVTNVKTIKSTFELTNKDGLITLADHYWLEAHQSKPNCHLCSILDIMQSDIRTPEDNEIYCDIIDMYGQDMADKFIHLNQDDIEKKIVKLINFAFDKVYHTPVTDVTLLNELELVFFVNDSDIQDTIENIIINNFDVYMHYEDHSEIHMSIRKLIK